MRKCAREWPTLGNVSYGNDGGFANGAHAEHIEDRRIIETQHHGLVSPKLCLEEGSEMKHVPQRVTLDRARGDSQKSRSTSPKINECLNDL